MVTRPHSNTNPSKYNNVGHWIKAARLSRGLSQRELAQVVGLSRGYINQWESNLYKPNPDACAVLSKLFDVPLADILALADRTRGRRKLAYQTRDGCYPMKVSVAPPAVDKPFSGCRKCDHQRQCRDAVDNNLPLPCEIPDRRDLFVAEQAGLLPVLLARYDDVPAEDANAN